MKHVSQQMLALSFRRPYITRYRRWLLQRYASVPLQDRTRVEQLVAEVGKRRVLPARLGEGK